MKSSSSSSQQAAAAAQTNAYRIIIADDHALVRRGLRQILADAIPGIEFGETSNVKETIDLIKQGEWSMIILDINMPGRSGIDVLREMRQNDIRIPVLVLSVHAEAQYALRALKAGATGYLCKESPAEQFIEAVQRILAGRPYITPILAEKLAEDFRGTRHISLLDRLSNREMEVLRLIGSGKTVKDISEQLGLSVKTISTYRVRLLSKLKMKSNAEIMRFSLDEGLVE